MKVYIVIPHYIISEQVAQFAKNAIKSFKDTADCIVVNCDDTSPFDSSFLKDISDVYIRNPKNLGFAGNCNVGFRYVLEHEKEDCFIVCANNDIEVYSHWLERFKEDLKFLDGDMIGGLGYQNKKDSENYETNPDSKFKCGYFSEGGRLEDWMFPGGFWLMKKSVIEDVGLLDENFKHGGVEDIDFFYRAKLKGKRLVMTPRVPYWHFEGATRYSDLEKGTQAKADVGNRAYFKKKYGVELEEELSNILVDNRINL